MRKTSRQLGFPAETEKLRSRGTYKNKKLINEGKSRKREGMNCGRERNCGNTEMKELGGKEIFQNKDSKKTIHKWQKESLHREREKEGKRKG